MATTYTYDNKAIREDLLAIITNLTPTETQLMTGLATSTAKATMHQWQTETLNAVKTNSYVEGVDASFPATTNTTRVVNYTQIFRNGVQVSGSDEAADSAGFASRMSHETTKKLKEFKNDCEYALMRGSLATGTGSAARQLNGVKNSMSAGNYTSSSGTTITEAILNDYFQAVWDDGVEVDAIYCPMYLKRKISAFTGGATKNVEVTDRRLVAAVDVYQADAASNVKLFAHRYVTVSGDTNYDLVGIKEDMFKIAYYRQPKIDELAKTGDSVKKEVIAELTMECLNANAGFWSAALC